MMPARSGCFAARGGVGAGCAGAARLSASVAAVSLVGTAPAQAPEDVLRHHDAHECLLNRCGVPFSTVPQRETDRTCRHRYGRDIAPGATHASFRGRHGRSCDGWYCAAKQERRAIFIIVAGETAATDIATVAGAAAGLARYCAAADKERG